MEKNYKNPVPTVDIIIEIDSNKSRSCEDRQIVLIYRKNPPYGWAIPGGFVDYGETLEEAAVREALEETSIRVMLVKQFHTYSDPKRDPRQHTISTVYIARAEGKPKAGDDAGDARIFSLNSLPPDMAFDHADILNDYKTGKY